MKCLDGELQETRYEWPAITDDEQEHEMVVKGRGFLKKNEVAYINGIYGFSINFFFFKIDFKLNVLKIRSDYIVLRTLRILK